MIVALDSADDSANYIHIADVKEKTIYYCPCCKGHIKPRAYKKDINYQVQPHFYHESEGCSEESFVHYICKTWLFDKGCKFKVNNKIYTVDTIETEKTLHTSFGDYRPDVIVNTESGKTFFFEIKYSNRKTELYAPKWDELENDVVEVDARAFINNKHDLETPEFKLIYSEGECFIKSYSRNDYEETIAIRKLEWKRQDKLNYKIQWERLDWFWEELCKYKNNHSTIENVSDMFTKLEFEDMDFAIATTKKMKCIELYKSFIPIINNRFFSIIETYDISPYKSIDLNQESPRIFYIGFVIYSVGNCKWMNSYCEKKYYEYYNNELLLKIKKLALEAKQYSYNDELPFLHEIKYLYKTKNLHEFGCRVYLNERQAIYSNNYNFRYENSCYSIDSSTSWEYLKNVIEKRHYSHQSKSKKNNLKYFMEYNNSFIYSFIVKKINSCKSERWSCEISHNWRGDIEIEINYNDDCHSAYSYIYNIEKYTKCELFKEIKKEMNSMVNGTQYNFRLMEVQK